MAKQFSHLSEQHIAFIDQQKIFFVATAAATGSVNLSPKGGDTLHILNPHQVAWLNLTGSGNESAAHIRQVARMTLMFCAFEGAPLILRLYGHAKAIHPGNAQWQEYSHLFSASVAARQIFLMDLELVQSSCGMAVPYYQYLADRQDLANWSERQSSEDIRAFWQTFNQTSIDGFATGIFEPNNEEG